MPFVVTQRRQGAKACAATSMRNLEELVVSIVAYGTSANKFPKTGDIAEVQRQKLSNEPTEEQGCDK